VLFIVHVILKIFKLAVFNYRPSEVVIAADKYCRKFLIILVKYDI